MSACQQVADFILTEGLLQQNQLVVAGISGGPDSLCLLDCLHGLGFPLVVGHLDHMLRPESGEEAAFVRHVAERYALEAVIGRAQVREMAGNGMSLEEAARLARYRFLVGVARAQGATVIATGHTADDQAETVLMHFLRGAGPSGLRGMLPATDMASWRGVPEASGITLIRPLLSIHRQDTQAHCRARGLSPVYDGSNQDTAFFRNRLRHELLPMLEEYNPGIRAVLIRMGQVMAGEAELLDALVEERWEDIMRRAGERALAVRRQAFLAQEPAIQRALIRSAIERLRPSLRDVGFDAVERVLEFMREGARGKRLPLTGGLVMLHLLDEVVISFPDAVLDFPQLPQLISAAPEEICAPCELQLSGGWRLRVAERQKESGETPGSLQDLGPFVARFDHDAVGGRLRLRPPQTGDRIRPLGMQGSLKVSDLFINEHVPQPARARWPLVVREDEVLWVAGLRMSEGVRLTDATRHVLEFRLLPPEEDES